MSAEIILLKVQNFLSNLQKEQGPELKFAQLGAFGETVSRVVRRQLSPDKPREFRLRASNLGRPGCVLQSEQLKRVREPEPYSSRFRNTYGDLIEAVAVITLKQAGVSVVAEQGGVELEISGKTISGTFDVVIDEGGKKLYDIKSCSGYAFKNHYFNKTLKQVWDTGDSFGYVTQLYFYARALNMPVGGLITINKEDGSWYIVEPPQDDEELRKLALQRAASNVIRLTSDQPFSKDFEPVKEYFRKIATGNEVLGNTCSFCSYKKSCWPGVVELPQVVSKGENPKKYYYTKLDEKFKK